GHGFIWVTYRCSGISRAVKTCLHMEISASKIDKIAWDYVCGVLRDLQIVQNAVSAMLESDAFASPEKSAVRTIEECKAVIAQYREDLKTPGLSKSARTVILEDLSKQTDLLEELENELAAIRAGRISYERVMQEYREFVAWCREFTNYE